MNVTAHPSSVAEADRWRITGGAGLTAWLTGLSGSGKSNVAYRVEELLVGSRRAAYVLDGDNLRHGLNQDLGFSQPDRKENVRRVAAVARLMAQAGVVALVPVISPYRHDRELARRHHEEAGVRFLEIYVATPIEVCELRDPKGLYVRARAGEISDFTGVDSPYEAPEAPDLVIDTSRLGLDECAAAIVGLVG